MATIKRNGNLIVLKGGKVSCTCCGEGCCMYPTYAQFPDDWTINDLPNTIVSPTGSLSKLEAEIEFALPDGSGNFTIYYGTYTSPLESEGVGLFNNQWAYKVGAGVSSIKGDCLFSDICFSEQDPNWFCDNFADTYSITWNALGDPENPITILVTRISLCVWEGIDPCGNPIYLYYGDSLERVGGPFWNVQLNSYVGDCLPDFLAYELAKDAIPPSYQNTPIGYYPEIFATDATVS